MNRLYRPALGTFNFICTILAGYMTFKQIQIYLENDDTSAISFQKFTDGPHDMYPTYTFCFEDSQRGDMYLDGKESLLEDVQLEQVVPDFGGGKLYYIKEGDKFTLSKVPKPYDANIHGGSDKSLEDDMVFLTLIPPVFQELPEEEMQSISSEMEVQLGVPLGHLSGIPNVEKPPGMFLGIPPDSSAEIHNEGRPPGMYLGMKPGLTESDQSLPQDPQKMLNEIHNVDRTPGNHEYIPYEVSSPMDNTESPPEMFLGMPPGMPGMFLGMPNNRPGMDLNSSPHFFPQTSTGRDDTGTYMEVNENDGIPSLMPLGMQRGMHHSPPSVSHTMDPHNLSNDSNIIPTGQDMHMEMLSATKNPNEILQGAKSSSSYETLEAANDRLHLEQRRLQLEFENVPKSMPEHFPTGTSGHMIERRKRMSNPMVAPTTYHRCKDKNNDPFPLYPTYNRRQETSFIVWISGGKTYGILPTHYQDLLMGIPHQYKYRPAKNTIIGEKDCEEIRYSLDDISKIVFDENIIDLKSFLLDYYIKTNDGSFLGWVNDTYAKLETVCTTRMLFENTFCGSQDSFKNHLKRRKPSGYPFKKVYQDPKKICYAPKANPDLHKESEFITLDLTKMWKAARETGDGQVSPAMTIHVHMPGQFMRSVGKEIASINLNDLVVFCPETEGIWGLPCHGTRLIYDISQVTLLKNRKDSYHICNSTLKDEDSKIIETILNDPKVNCLPTYWMGWENYHVRYPRCTTDTQYKRINEITANFTSHELIRKKFNPPCEIMSIVTNVQKVKGRKRRDKPLKEPDFNGYSLNPEEIGESVKKMYLDIQFRLVNDGFQVITNTRGFTAESCWAGIGGFIGIFVGMSLMQLPEIFFAFYTFLFKTTRKAREIADIESKFKI